MCRAYEQYGKGVVGIKEVSEEAIQKYSSMKVNLLNNNLYEITDMIEKPKPDQILSLFSILGRCVLPYEIFEILERIPYGAGNELQLTDAMKELAINNGMVGVDFTGKRYDMGNKLGILQAAVEVGVKHKEFGDEFVNYLKEFVKNI